MIDVVIPAHAKDFSTARITVRSALRHVVPLRAVHVVSADEFPYRDDRVHWVREPNLPTFPSLREVSDRLSIPRNRAPWIYQQLLKLGAGEYIDGLSPRYLAVDADVVFLRRVSFGEKHGRFPYSRATEYNEPYHEAYRRLLGEEARSGHSFVAHHMLYDRELLGELLGTVERRHGQRWWWAYLDAVVPNHNAISEWETYGLWVVAHHPHLARHRQLFWKDARLVPGPVGRAVLGLDFDFVAAHHYSRESRGGRTWHVAKRLVGELVAPLRR